MQTVVNGQLINFLHQPGGRQTLLVLPGWGRTSADWGFLLSATQLAKTHTVYVLDLPGFGGSPAPKTNIGVQGYAQLVADFCHKRKLKNVDIMGHSFGGRLAIILAATQPNLINAMMLVDSGGIEKKPFKVRCKIFLYKLIWKPVKKIVPSAIKKAFGSTDYQNLSSGIMRQVFVDIVNTNLMHHARAITAKTLIIWGRRDTTLPLWHAAWWKNNIANARLKIAWDSGHHPQLDQPVWLTTTITEFIQPKHYES